MSATRAARRRQQRADTRTTTRRWHQAAPLHDQPAGAPLPAEDRDALGMAAMALADDEARRIARELGLDDETVWNMCGLDLLEAALASLHSNDLTILSRWACHARRFLYEPENLDRLMAGVA